MEDNLDFSLEFKVSKHFRNIWIRKWNCDIIDLRNACLETKKIVKVGKRRKYEIYIKLKGKSRKLVINPMLKDAIFVITGAEGHGSDEREVK